MIHLISGENQRAQTELIIFDPMSNQWNPCMALFISSKCMIHKLNKDQKVWLWRPPWERSSSVYDTISIPMKYLGGYRDAGQCIWSNPCMGLRLSKWHIWLIQPKYSFDSYTVHDLIVYKLYGNTDQGCIQLISLCYALLYWAKFIFYITLIIPLTW